MDSASPMYPLFGNPLAATTNRHRYLAPRDSSAKTLSHAGHGVRHLIREIAAGIGFPRGKHGEEIMEVIGVVGKSKPETMVFTIKYRVFL